MATSMSANSSLSESKIISIKTEHESQLFRYKALIDEAIFIVNSRLNENNIKIHSVEGRVKDINSTVRKIERKSDDTELSDIHDISAIRIVCLFRDDIEIINSVIKNNFIIISYDDKISSSIDSFGYMSIHYICQMRDDYQGPRYEAIKSLNFEIQIRTICMHGHLFLTI